jgi:hypothetical protein
MTQLFLKSDFIMTQESQDAVNNSRPEAEQIPEYRTEHTRISAMRLVGRLIQLAPGTHVAYGVHTEGVADQHLGVIRYVEWRNKWPHFVVALPTRKNRLLILRDILEFDFKVVDEESIEGLDPRSCYYTLELSK